MLNRCRLDEQRNYQCLSFSHSIGMKFKILKKLIHRYLQIAYSITLASLYNTPLFSISIIMYSRSQIYLNTIWITCDWRKSWKINQTVLYCTLNKGFCLGCCNCCWEWTYRQITMGGLTSCFTLSNHLQYFMNIMWMQWSIISDLWGSLIGTTINNINLGLFFQNMYIKTCKWNII